MLFKKRNALQKAINKVGKVAENHEVVTVVGATVVTVAAGYGGYTAVKNGVNFAKETIANRETKKIEKVEKQIADIQEKIAKATDPEMAKKLNEKLTKLQDKLQKLINGNPDTAPDELQIKSSALLDALNSTGRVTS